jgi:predicted NAD-dependent protein-ADP-ribosyltransferase YbiA (DUF1768 family)
MVLSRLNNTIDYPDIRKVDEEDVGFNSALYSMDVYDIDIIIALGNIRYSFVTKGVLYVPAYLVVNDRVVSQIGVFECLNRDYTKLLDIDNDIDLNLLDYPLLYSFVTKEYIITLQGEKTEEEEDDVEEEVVMDDGGGEVEVEELIEKTEDEYNQMSKNNWVQKFLNNGNYEIIDNEGGGDCLFASIRDAFSVTNTPHSVDEQRVILAEAVTQDTFDNYTTIYNDLLKELEKNKKERAAIKKQFGKVKKLHKENRADKEKAGKYAKMGAELRTKYDQLTKEGKNTTRIIEDEFKMMKGLNTLADFKEFIKTCDFWGDMWAISTLERALNVKLIILSSQSYHQGDLKNVLQCGQLADNILEKDGAFRPQYYIILDYIGIHYKLITYKDRKIFTFKDLPYGLVKLIVTTCMTGDGVFDKIPAFQKFKGGETPLYNDNTVFMFYSKSQNKPPGKGAGEKIPAEDVDKFAKLAAMKDWRKVLSNFYIDPFEKDGKTWNTVEHLYQGSKFKEGNPEFYEQFSLGSGSVFSENPVLAKAAGGKTGTAKLPGESKRTRLRPTTVTADDTFWAQKNEIMKDALLAKFTQNELPRDVLQETQNAKLTHYLGRGQGVETWNHLMQIRKDI